MVDCEFRAVRPKRAASSILVALCIAAAPSAALATTVDDAELSARVERVLAATPVIDGHNDLPSEIRDRFDSDITKVDLRKNTAAIPRRHDAPEDEAPLMTDIPRMRKGHLGGQFW